VVLGGGGGMVLLVFELESLKRGGWGGEVAVKVSTLWGKRPKVERKKERSAECGSGKGLRAMTGKICPRGVRKVDEFRAASRNGGGGWGGTGDGESGEKSQQVSEGGWIREGKKGANGIVITKERRESMVTLGKGNRLRGGN